MQNENLTTCPRCGCKLRLGIFPLDEISLEETPHADTEQDTFTTALSVTNPRPFLVKESVNVTDLEISPRIVRTRHPIDKLDWKHTNTVLKRLGFKWHSEGELSRWQR